MSGAFDTATYLISIGSGGAAITVLVEAARTWRSAGNRLRKRRNTMKITVNVPDRKLRLEVGTAADVSQVINILSQLIKTEASQPEEVSHLKGTPQDQGPGTEKEEQSGGSS
jgi:hypothetical protein